MFPIVKHPNKSLRKISIAWNIDEILLPETQKLVDEMIETMKQEKGVGLAAPQIGLNKRLFVGQMENGSIEAFFNPKIISVSETMVKSEEGCLSIPQTFGLVLRHKKVKIKAIDRKKQKIQLTATGLLAIIFQHEIDHLNGILFIDQAIKLLETDSKGSIV